MYPVGWLKTARAVAVLPAPASVKVVINPVSSMTVSICSIEVSITSSSYSNNSHFNS